MSVSLKENFNNDANAKRYLSRMATKITEVLEKKRPLAHDSELASIFINSKYKGTSALQHIVNKTSFESTTDFISNVYYGGYDKTAKELITNFVSANDIKEGYLLHIAARFNDTDMTQLILDKAKEMRLDKAEVINKVNEKGNTPLHVATYYGRSRVVDVLVDNDADTLVLDAEGYSSKQIAIINEYKGIKRTLKYVEKYQIKEAKIEEKKKDELKKIFDKSNKKLIKRRIQLDKNSKKNLRADLKL